ncbi:LAQU0S01e03070g1_1 [Lachancea quebecensis]|uniref:LAQU0S01e03070g1_1 n=1 Tax=Lachancea quebecensis TaxID=1654605 RepID=A0A0P1KKS2_9SACH|nr:LAQU0S01e03070g1_1 [Lachancea quebecensis]
MQNPSLLGCCRFRFMPSMFSRRLYARSALRAPNSTPLSVDTLSGSRAVTLAALKHIAGNLSFRSPDRLSRIRLETSSSGGLPLLEGFPYRRSYPRRTDGPGSSKSGAVAQRSPGDARVSDAKKQRIQCRRFYALHWEEKKFSTARRAGTSTGASVGASVEAMHAKRTRKPKREELLIQHGAALGDGQKFWCLCTCYGML